MPKRVITRKERELPMLLDISPFSHRLDEHDAQVFRWEEPREIYRIELEYSDKNSMPSLVDVEYWQDKWPDSRPKEEDLESGRAGRAAWKGMDDWFNGRWLKADTRVARNDNTLVITFAPLGATEFPDLSEYSVTFRRTLQLRITQGTRNPAERVQVFTNTEVQERMIHVELSCGLQPRPTWDGHVEVYNGHLENLTEPSADDPRLHLKILCACPRAFSHDATVVTIRSSSDSFSFRPDDLLTGKPLWIPDLHALVTLGEMDVRFGTEFLEGMPTKLSVYDRIEEVPEQTLDRALGDNPPKRPMHFIVGIEGRRQKFGVEANGDVFAGIGFVRQVPGPDTDKVSWEGRRLYFHFHWGDMTPNGRFLEEGYLPIHRATFSEGSLDIHQEVLATKLLGSMGSTPIRGEDLVMAMVRLTFENRGDDGLEVEQRISCGHRRSSLGELVLRGNLVYAGKEGKTLRMAIDVDGKGKLSSSGGLITYRVLLRGGKSHSIIVKIPFVDLLSPEEVESLQGKSWDVERAEVKAYWKSRIAKGTQIHTGVRDMDDFYKALLTHILINDDHEVDSNRITGRVSSFNYGNFSNEAIMQILELDRRGYHEEARRHLDTYLHYQGTVALPGNFEGKDGLFYGSGGYESGSYNQHHGWVLWGLAEHFRYTGDEAWLRKIADGLVAGCEWIIRERRATMTDDGRGRRCLEYGFLPAGSVEDVREFCYWLSTNSLTYRGLAAAAEALKSIGHPEGPRLVSEARMYRDDLLEGIQESTIRSPVVPLGDGTHIPHLPSRLYWRGRDVGWIREVLEGSYIAVGTVLDPGDQRSTWILKDFECNRYLDAPFNYALDDFEAQWFSRGGFSMQPNLVYGLSPYLPRDEIQHFLRAFFNGFAACWRPEIRSMTEHPLPTLADWDGDHFKSSDESMVAYSLRSMFIHEDGDDLYLGKAIPRSWLAPGSEVGIESAQTHFGQMSLEIAISPDAKKIVARIDPPKRVVPRRMILRLRHPHKARPSRVTIDGKPQGKVDPGKEWIVLPSATQEITIVAEYDLLDG